MGIDHSIITSNTICKTTKQLPTFPTTSTGCSMNILIDQRFKLLRSRLLLIMDISRVQVKKMGSEILGKRTNLIKTLSWSIRDMRHPYFWMSRNRILWSTKKTKKWDMQKTIRVRIGPERENLGIKHQGARKMRLLFACQNRQYGCRRVRFSTCNYKIWLTINSSSRNRTLFCQTQFLKSTIWDSESCQIRGI